MYEYMDIYDIALMPLDALSAIAFDLPPNEFQLDPRYILVSSALPHLYLYRMCHSCATRALEMESPSLNAHTHACLTVYSALQKCLAWKDRQTLFAMSSSSFILLAHFFRVYSKFFVFNQRTDSYLQVATHKISISLCCFLFSIERENTRSLTLTLSLALFSLLIYYIRYLRIRVFFSYNFWPILPQVYLMFNPTFIA